MCNLQKVVRSLFTTALAALLVAPLSASLGAQELSGRSRIELRLGVGIRANSSTTMSGSGVQIEAGTAGFLGSVGYAHWLNEGLALTGSAGVLAAEAKASAGSSGFQSRSASVFLLFIGARYYLPTSNLDVRWRPYASAELGPVVGSQSWLELGRATTGEAITTAALGTRVGGGVDFHLGQRALFGVSVGYHLMTDFPEAIGGQENHSGPDIGLSIGLLFGASARQSDGQRGTNRIRAGRTP